MESIEEALKTAGAEDDLQTILRVLEDNFVGFKRQEAAAGPFANMDTAMFTGLNVRMLSVIKRAQQQQQHPGRLSVLNFASHCRCQQLICVTSEARAWTGVPQQPWPRCVATLHLPARACPQQN